jgi:hypothetical protein
MTVKNIIKKVEQEAGGQDKIQNLITPISNSYELVDENFTAEVGKNYAVDTSSGAVSVTLPTNPQTGDVIGLADARGTWMTNAVTILRNGNKIEASNVNFSNNASGSFFSVVFIDSTTGWRILTSGTKPLNINPPAVSGLYDFSATSGTWTGNPTTFTYQWQMSTNGTTGWADIGGATSSTYLALEADEGKYVRVGVVATNSNGSSVIAYSAASAAINLPDFPTSDLLAFWKLDDLTDSSGNGYTLTNNNSVTFGAGKIGDAAQFDGSNYLTASILALGGSFTLSFWLNPSTTSGYRNVLTWRSDGTGSIGYNGTIYWYADNGGFLVQSSSGIIQTSVWQHVVLTCNANSMTIYHNGVSVATGTDTNTRTATNLTIGAFTNGSEAVVGDLDAVGIWLRALSIEEIGQLYNSGNGVEP